MELSGILHSFNSYKLLRYLLFTYLQSNIVIINTQRLINHIINAQKKIIFCTKQILKKTKFIL